MAGAGSHQSEQVLWAIKEVSSADWIKCSSCQYLDRVGCKVRAKTNMHVLFLKTNFFNGRGSDLRIASVGSYISFLQAPLAAEYS